MQNSIYTHIQYNLFVMFGSSDKRNLDDVYDKLEAINSKLGELTNIQETIETNHKETVSALGNIESAIKNTETFFKDTNSKLGELIKVASDQSI